jgi:hypothetical protein
MELKFRWILTLLLTVSAQHIYDPNLHYLGANLITNADFSTPTLPLGSYNQAYPSIDGWSCSVECQLKDMVPYFSSRGITADTNLTQGIDLDS